MNSRSDDEKYMALIGDLKNKLKNPNTIRSCKHQVDARTSHLDLALI
jgi:hypothetical protein